MTAKSKGTRRISRELRERLAKVDAHIVTQEEYDEIPEITDDDIARGVMSKGLTVLPTPKPRGRPPKEAPKVLQSLRLSPDVLEGFRALGPGWQTRIDEVLRAWLKRRRQKRNAA